MEKFLVDYSFYNFLVRMNWNVFYKYVEFKSFLVFIIWVI